MLKVSAFVWWIGIVVFIPSGLHAATKKIDDLSAQQLSALQESQQRLTIFDRSLQALDARHARHKISSREYVYQKHDLMVLICGEAEFENALLTRNPSHHFDCDLDEAMATIARYSAVAAMYALMYGFQYLGSMK